MSEVSLVRLNAALDGRYRLERELGEGGMATVYLAEDLRHERKVALKVLKPDLAEAVGAERFLVEIKTTAKLQHPHILPLFDSGEADGFLFYVMPYVQGESLRERLEREPQLPIDEALRIVADVADALDYAHSRSVVHRDIKPANILMSAGQPLIADFGIALSRSDASATRLTSTSGSVGTPTYMAPEQASGDHEVDGRTDVYALACVLYRLLAGEPPHTGSSVQVILAKKLTQAHAPLKSLRPAVPALVDRAVTKALQVVPLDRQASAAEFARELRAAHDSMSIDGDTPWFAVPPGGWGTQRVALRRRSRLIGREQELDVLRGALDGALTGAGSLVLVGGEPGVGKTRLVEEILHEAMDRGALVVIGHCTEMDATSAYAPLVEQLDSAARLVPSDVFRAALGSSASELTRLIPRLRETFPDIPPPAELPPDVQRRNLFRHYCEFVGRASRVAPIVALYDDLQWSDEATLLLLQYMAPYLAQLPVLTIGTYRASEREQGAPWRRALESFTRQRLAERIVLEPMARSEVASLLAELGGSEPPTAVVRAVFEGTEGNPFFVEEVFRHLSDEGRLFGPDDAWRSDLSAKDLDVPEGVRLVIGRRVERLAEDTRKMLAPAALIGRVFYLRVLEELQVLDAERLLDALDEAEAARLIVSAPGGRQAKYEFTHELIRQTLAQTLSRPRRQRWHKRIADAIKRAYPGQIERRAADLAYHLYEAGGAADVDETREACILAARQALEGTAFEEALAYVERTYSLGEGEPSASQRLVLERIRAAALWGTGIGAWPEAVERWMGALAIAEALEDGPAIVEICIAVNFGLLALDDHEAARTTARKGLAVLGDATVPARALLLAKLGLGETFVGFQRSSDAFEEAEALASSLDDPLTLGRVLTDKSGYLLTWGRPLDVVAVAERGLELLDLSSDPMSWIVNESHVVVGLHVTALHPDIVGRAAELASVSERYGNLYGLTFAVRAQMDMALYAGGDWATYEQLCATAAQLHAVFPSTAGRGQLFLAQCELNRREAAKAYDMIREGASRTSTVGAWSPTWAGTILWHAVRARASDVDRRAETVLRTLPSASEPLFIGWYDGLMASVEAFARMGRLEDAASLRPHMDVAMERGWKTGGGGLLSLTCAGIAAAAAGDWEGAERHFDEADRFCGSRIVFFPPRTNYWRAWMHHRRGAPGDRERAKQLLEQARAQFGSLGMMLDVDDTEALLAQV